MTVNQRTYQGEQLNKVAFPIGGMGAGMFCLEGNGSLSHISLRHKPNVFYQPFMFASIAIKQNTDWVARIIQGKTPDWKINFPFKGGYALQDGGFDSTSGAYDMTFGYPYFRDNSFDWKFPFANVNLKDKAIPVDVKLTGWSPFTPGNADDSSLPMGVLEYTFSNTSDSEIEAVFTFASTNIMRDKSPDKEEPGKEYYGNSVLKTKNGFILHQDAYANSPKSVGDFAIVALEEANVNCRWFRGGWFDRHTILWNSITKGETQDTEPYPDDESQSQGANLTIAFKLAPKQSKTIRLLMTWYVPYSDIHEGTSPKPDICDVENFYRPWYASKFNSVNDVMDYAKTNYERLYQQSKQFSDDFFSLNVDEAITEAAGANLAILKSPTVLRQFDGRFWAWEGCNDMVGSCHGSCTHVWNYAQAVAHLFPDLERTIRQGEFNEAQDSNGRQAFRLNLPISDVDVEEFSAAADGQLGTIMKVHRDWKICGDNQWLSSMWPKLCDSINYCIRQWDPDEKGALFEPHHNTYDIDFWGADGMCTSFYLGALKAMVLMGDVLGKDVGRYQRIYDVGRKFMETELFNGEFFIQKIQLDGLRTSSPLEVKNLVDPSSGYTSEESLKLLAEEGPKYQYGIGCLSDGVIGAWMAEVCGIGEILDSQKVKSHLLSVYKYNFRTSLHNHANPQRQTYALNDDAGLLLCTWPNGGELSLPFVYSNEVWTGIEYQVASHLAMVGEKDKALVIIKALRKRYNGVARNPFNEYECGAWYARALASYSLLQAFGVRQDFT